MTKVMLVDDEVSVRQGLLMRLELEPDLIVVGEAKDGSEALELVQALKPGVVVMDLEMPEMDGFTATERLREVAPFAHVVILSIHDESGSRVRAQVAGATAFVGKQEPFEHLLEAIRGVVHNDDKGSGRGENALTAVSIV